MRRVVFSVCAYALVAAEASKSCDRSSGDVCPTKDHAMIQLSKAGTERVTQQLEDRSNTVSLAQLLIGKDQEIAQAMREARNDPDNIAASVGKGVTAVVEAVQNFMQPGGIKKGLKALGTGILDAIASPIRKKLGKVEYNKFKTKWLDFFQIVPESIGSISKKIDEFQKTGKGPVLIDAIGDILQALNGAVIKSLPTATTVEVMKFINTLDDVLESLATSWTGFEKGQHGEAIKALMTGLKAGLDGSLPKELRNDKTYKKIMGTIDKSMESLTKHVSDYMRRINEATCCYKTSYTRGKRRPERCATNWYNNGEGLCLPPTRLQQMQANQTTETSLQGKKPEGARPATCDPDGKYPGQHSNWCYKKCNKGYTDDGAKCELLCGTTVKFPSDGGAALCGVNAGAVQQAIMQMVTVTLNNVINAAGLISKMVKDGFDADVLAKTINTFVDMGKPFAYPTCKKPKPKR